MEERSLVGVLRLAKSKTAPAEDETSEAMYRREQASKFADCILHTYKHNREESDKLIKDPDFLQEVKQVSVTCYFKLRLSMIHRVAFVQWVVVLSMRV